MGRALATTLAALLLSGVATPVAAHPSRVVTNCAGDTTGEITWLAPAAGAVLPAEFRIRLSMRCDEGVPFNIGIDGIGYELRRGRLVANPDYNPGCAHCWPQLGVEGEEGVFDHPVLLDPGTHVLRVQPGIQGTDLPTFEPIEFTVVVRDRLPATGSGVGLLSVVAALLGLVGAILLRIGTVRRTRTRLS